MTAAEVWFLRAEAALRGISTEDPKICYETGVKTSFEQWGVGVVDAYLQSDKTPADYKDPFDTQFDMNARITTTPNWADANGTEEQFEKIMTQKWLAIYPEGNEAWTVCKFRLLPRRVYQDQPQHPGCICTCYLLTGGHCSSYR